MEQILLDQRIVVAMGKMGVKQALPPLDHQLIDNQKEIRNG
jgi:hypothetical protein